MNDAQLIAHLTQAITQLPGDGVKVVSIVGGAASGKSTLTQALIVALEIDGLIADSISTDDFCLGTREWRWAHSEGAAEGAELLDPLRLKDFDLMRQKVAAVKAGQGTVAVPTYDSATGLAISAGEANYTHKIENISVLFVEGDFYPITDSDLTVFVDLPDADRLQNRIDRDLASRNGGNATKVTDSFNYRQQSQHIPYTLSAKDQADIVVSVNASQPTRSYTVH